MAAAKDTPRVDRVARVVPAPAAAIYAALTDGQAVARWLPPHGMRGEILAFEPRPGGAYSMILHYEDAAGAPGKTDAGSDRTDGRFVELVENERVVQAVRFDSDDPAFGGEMRMTWTLTPVAGGTAVAVVAENVPPGIAPDAHEEGIASTLLNLERFVTGQGAD